MLAFSLVLVRIWVDGFTHLFTMLSLIAAGLVVTNKENIMNIVGWLIINWRGVFSEGDYIKIQNVMGYVESVKLFSFKLIETNEMGEGIATGKTIKVPNGTIITNPIYIFPSTDTLMLQRVEYEITMDSPGLQFAHQAQETVKRVIQETYANGRNYSMKTIQKNNKLLSNLIDLEPKIHFTLIRDKTDKVLLTISFYAYPKDRPTIENRLVLLMVNTAVHQTEKTV